MIETILAHYITCALWSSTGTISEEDLELEVFEDSGLEIGDDYELDSYFDQFDLSDEAFEKMEKDVTDFLALIESEGVSRENWSDEQLGHDFWLSRNGHGTGFFDRGFDEGYKLQKLAKTYGSCDLYVGDDGRLYV